MALFARLRVQLADGEVRDFATQALENLGDLRPAFRVILKNLRRFETKVFATQGEALLGKTWEPLRARTVTARRNRRGHYAQASSERPTRRILHWTHALRDSVTKDGARGSVAIVAPRSL